MSDLGYKVVLTIEANGCNFDVAIVARGEDAAGNVYEFGERPGERLFRKNGGPWEPAGDRWVVPANSYPTTVSLGATPGGEPT